MKLDRVRVAFELFKDGDKDQDTKVQLVITKADGSVIAQADDIAPGQVFKFNGTYGPFDVNILDGAATPDEFVHGKTRITITPKGGGRWSTNILVMLSWSSTKRACKSNRIFLSQAHPSKSWSNLPFQDDLSVPVARCRLKEKDSHSAGEGDEHTPPGESVILCPRGTPKPFEPHPLEGNQSEVYGVKTPCWNMGKVVFGGAGYPPYYRLTAVSSPPIPDPTIAKVVLVRLLVLDFYSNYWWEPSVNQDLAWAAYRGVGQALAEFNGNILPVITAGFQNWSDTTDRWAAINVIYEYL